jgi:mannosyltransferase
MTEGSDGDRARERLLAALAVLACLPWVAPIASSLWIDEIGTWWNVKGGIGPLLARAHDPFARRSLLYYLVVSVSASGLGVGEVALRLPSLLSSALAVVFLARLGARVADRETGLLCAIAFAVHKDVAFAAVDARPYAVALLALIAASLALVRWLDEGRWRDALLWALLAALALHAHLVFAPVWSAHAVYAALRVRGGASRATRGQAVAALALLAVAAAPLASFALAVSEKRADLVYAPRPELHDLLIGLAPPALVVAVIAGVAAARATGSGLTSFSDPAWAGSPARGRAGIALALLWLLVPHLLLFAISWLTATRIYTPRYLVSAAPGLALALAWAIRSFGPARARLVIAAAIALAGIATNARTRHTADDWRAVARVVGDEVRAPDTPVLLGSGFVDARADALETDANVRAFVLSPAAYYSLPGRITPLPFRLDEAAESYVERLVERERLASAERFLIIARGLPPPAWNTWFDGRLGAGFTARAHDLNGVKVYVYDRKK